MTRKLTDVFAPYANSKTTYGNGTRIQFWDSTGHECATITAVIQKPYGVRYELTFDSGKISSPIDVHAWDHKIL